jgi:hypothetical protein
MHQGYHANQQQHRQTTTTTTTTTTNRPAAGAPKQTRPNAATLASITMQHLISANLIPPGDRTFSVGTIHNIKASLTPDGTIHFEGKPYAHPSAFAVAVTRKYRNSTRMSANGWLETSITDCFHAPTKLASIRQWYKDNVVKNLPPQPLPQYRDRFAQPPLTAAPPQPQPQHPQQQLWLNTPATATAYRPHHIVQQQPQYPPQQRHPPAAAVVQHYRPGPQQQQRTRSFF